MPVLLHAFKSGTITDNPLTNVATSVNSAGFSALPVVANPDTAWLVLDPEGAAGTPEIVQLTVHTAAATVGTVVRGQQTAFGGSAARQHAVGTKWVLALTPSDLLFLLNQVLTTKGDIPVFSTTPTRQPVGANGTVLTANSSQATGLEWVTPNPRQGVRLERATDWSITVATDTWNAVPWDVEIHDPLGMHSGSDPFITIPVGLGGVWTFTFSGIFFATVAPSIYSLTRGSAFTIGSTNASSHAVGTFEVSAGEQLQVFVYQSSGTNPFLLANSALVGVNRRSYFSAYRISD